jgi:hypothetical protein
MVMFPARVFASELAITYYAHAMPTTPLYHTQFIFNDGSNGNSNANMTISLAADPGSCWDGMSGGPNGSFQLMTHMWQCYNNPGWVWYEAVQIRLLL